MRVLHIINNLGSGGAEKLIEQSLPLFNEYGGIEVDVLLLTDKNNVLDKSLVEKNIKIDIIPIKKPRSLINVFYIKSYIEKGNYDIVHAHLFPAFYWVSLSSKMIFKNKPKFLFTEHSTYNKRRNKWYFKYIEKFIYSNFDKIISISDKTQENLLKWLNIKEDQYNKFIVIENGINIEKFKRAKPYKKEKINSDFKETDKLICMVGRFSTQKDQATIIKAIKKIPKNIHLLLIGEGKLKEKNKNLAEKLDVLNRIHFLGFRNDIDKIYKTVDIVVLSSNWEGFGLAALEGMAAGKPVVASNVSGLKKLVQGAGLLFPRGDDKKLAEKIKNLLSNYDKYKRTSDLCFKRSQLFDIKKMVQRYINEYKKLNDD